VVKEGPVDRGATRAVQPVLQTTSPSLGQGRRRGFLYGVYDTISAEIVGPRNQHTDNRTTAIVGEIPAHQNSPQAIDSSQTV
jgi:hypothetical protein